MHDVILDAGGATARSSTRPATRAGVESAVDLLAFQMRGDLTQSPLVEEGTKIHVAPRTGTVAGRRGAPAGEYELGPRPLRGLLELVGGMVQPAADVDARLTRLGTDGRKENILLDLRAALKPPGDVLLQPGDAIYIPPSSGLQDLVEVRGAFNGTPESTKTTTGGKPTIIQRFELAQGDRIRDIVAQAGGAVVYADQRLALVERNGVTGPRQRILIDLQRLLVEKDETPNIALQNGDVVLLPVAEDRVFILGEVKQSGPHDYRPDYTREYVALAGGASNRGRLDNTVVTFRNGRPTRWSTRRRWSRALSSRCLRSRSSGGRTT